MAFWTRIFAVLGAGAAARSAAAAVDPVIEVVKQDAYQANPFKILDLFSLASLVAQGLVDQSAAVNHAERNGYDANKLGAAIQLSLKGAPIAEALDLWRRKLITDVQMKHALDKAQIEEQYHAPIMELFVGRLDPAIIATAIQRGIMRDPGFLPVEPPSGSGNVEPFPVSPLDPILEAQAHGVDRERLFVETAIVGLPASAQQAASAYFRGIITLNDYYRAISEGNTRNEWRDPILEQARQILTAHDYAELELRGFLTKPERLNGTDKHGMSHADSDLLFDVLGRAIPEHQVVTGEARGGTFRGDFSNIPEAFLSSLRRSNIRPEYYSLAYANRYTYPSAFVLRSLTQNGDITQTESHQILLDIGWRPDLAEKVSARWAGGTGAAADPHVSKAENQLWTTTHKVFVLGDADEGQARSMLGRLAIPGPAQDQILALWQAERTLRRKELTDAALRKAVKGQQLTRQEALDELVARGYTTEDANIFLDQSPKPA